MKPGELLQACQEIYKSFDPSKMTVDSHAEKFLLDKKIREGGDALFLKQVLYGCVRYKKVLKLAVTHFYSMYSGSLIRSDFDMYMILSYLAIFRLKDLSFPIFRQFLMSQESQKMFLFVAFLFDGDNLNNVLKEEWLKYFDRKYVEDTIIAGLLSFSDEISGTAELLETKTKGTRSRKTATGDGEAEQSTTTVQPFNLTKPKPRVIPEPEAIESNFKAKDVPQAVYEGPRKLEKKIEEAKKKNRIEIEEKYTSASAATMKLRTAERPSNLEQIRRQVEEERDAELKFEGIKAKPAPQFRPSTQNRVKLNMAAILREEAVYKKQQEQEAAMLKVYEEELRDASNYYKWQTEMKEKDEEERRLEVERRRIEMAMADLEAKEAREQKILENKVKAAAAQKEALERLEHMKEELEKDKERAKKKVEEVIITREAARQAKEETRVEKAKVVSELAAEKREMKKKIEEEREKDMQEKADLVRQIRAAESLIAGTGGGGLNSKLEMFDPTETGGHMLLEEMSIAELRERLATLKVREMEEREEKRQEIIAAKQAKEREIMEKMKVIQSVRVAAERQTLEKRQAKTLETVESEKTKAKTRYEAMLELNSKLEAKKKARLEEQAQLEKEMRATRLRKQFLQADKDMVEEKRYRDLERGAERDIVTRQRVRATLAARNAEAKETDEKNRLLDKKRAEKQAKQRLKEIETKMEMDRQETMELLEKEAEVKASMAQIQREREKDMLAETAARQPYAAKMSRRAKQTAANASSSSKQALKEKTVDSMDQLRAELAPARYTDLENET